MKSQALPRNILHYIGCLGKYLGKRPGWKSGGLWKFQKAGRFSACPLLGRLLQSWHKPTTGLKGPRPRVSHRRGLSVGMKDWLPDSPPPLAEGSPTFWVPLMAGLQWVATRPLLPPRRGVTGGWGPSQGGYGGVAGHPPQPTGRGFAPSTPSSNEGA